MAVIPLFRDRTDAGQALAERIKGRLARRKDPLVLALPRGGVPVGYEVARALRAELDVLIVRKIGLPGDEELALGAVASGGSPVLNEQLIRRLRVPAESIDRVTQAAMAEIERQERLYREHRGPVSVAGRSVVLVDDGLATGATMRAAATAVRQREPESLVIAVPVAPRETCLDLLDDADEVICLATPAPFVAVGHWYESFNQVADEEVRLLLRQANARHHDENPDC